MSWAYFTRTPYENWSRHETRVLGSVVLHLDHQAPVAELRAEARRLVEASPLWDRRDWMLQVVDVMPATLVVQLLASSADAPSSWDLRCELREGMVNFLKKHHPDTLSQGRAVAYSGDQWENRPFDGMRQDLRGR